MPGQNKFGGGAVEFDLPLGRHLVCNAAVSAYLKPRRNEIWMHGTTDIDITVNLSHTATTRLRLLSEMDGRALSNFDNMQISEVDYITV